MVIWLNGAFGAGKTQTAFELQRRLKDAFVFDPEEAGYYIRANLPDACRRPDFQDYPMWRDFNLRMLKYICETYGGTVIVPMTVTSRDYFDELVGGLIQSGVDVRHFILAARRETLEKRLRGRFEGNRSWAAAQIDRCLTAFSTVITETAVETDRLSIPEAAEAVAALCALTLSPRQGRLKRLIDRAAVQIRHIRS